MEPQSPVIDVQYFTMFKQIMAIVMLQEMNRTRKEIDKVFGYEVLDRGYGPVYCDDNGLYVSGIKTGASKISSWNVREFWNPYLGGSMVYFCTSREKPVQNYKIFMPSSCYYFSSKTKDIIHLMDSGSHFETDMENIQREKDVQIMRLDAHAETYFQNSTLQGSYEQWYSVWRLYIDSYCKYHNVQDLHFYSVLDPAPVQNMYENIPTGMWTTMAEMHHEFFMHNYAPDFI